MPQARSALFAARPLIAAMLALVVAGGVLPGPTVAAGGAVGPAPEPAGTGIGSVGSGVADAPVAGPPTPDTDPAATPDGAGQHPSIAYEQAMAHADDTIAFKPGGRVTVGFQPRKTDDWPVDNRPPTDLPAGRATGAEMAKSAQGSDWADLGTSANAAKPAAAVPDDALAPVDAAGGTAIDASGASYVAPVADNVDLAAARGLRRQVFGFLPYWELSGAVEQAQQRRALDDRLLLGGRRPPRQPAQEGQRRHATPPAGAAGPARA